MVMEELLAASKPLFKACSDCKKAEAIWTLRAKQKFLCDKCKNKLEWGTE